MACQNTSWKDVVTNQLNGASGYIITQAQSCALFLLLYFPSPRFGIESTSRAFFMLRTIFIMYGPLWLIENARKEYSICIIIVQSKEYDSLLQAESSDLISYGLIPEFIGRFPVLVSLAALNEDQLVQVYRTNSQDFLFI